jgi:hypothetical protein
MSALDDEHAVRVRNETKFGGTWPRSHGCFAFSQRLTQNCVRELSDSFCGGGCSINAFLAQKRARFQWNSRRHCPLHAAKASHNSPYARERHLCVRSLKLFHNYVDNRKISFMNISVPSGYLDGA